MKKKSYFIIVGLIFILAALLRFYKLGKIPVSLYWDEAAMYIDAKTIAASGKDMHQQPWYQAIFVSYGDFKLPVYIWLASLAFKTLQPAEWVLRLPAALAGLTQLTIIVLLAKKLFLDKKTQLNTKQALNISALIVLGLSPWAIYFSRSAFEGQLGQFFLSLAVLLVLCSKKNKFYLYLAQLTAILATYSYFSVRFVWPVIFVTASLFLPGIIFKQAAISNPSKKLMTYFKQTLFYLVLPLGLYFILLKPMYRSSHYAAMIQFRYSTPSVLNITDWPLLSNQYRELAGDSLLDRGFYHRNFLAVQELAANYAENLSLNFLFLNGDPNLRHGTGQHGLFLFPFLISFIAGLLMMFANKRKELLFLLVWILIALLPASVPETTPHALRSLNALLPFSLIISYGLAPIIQTILTGLTSKANQQPRLSIKLLAAAAYLLWIVISVGQFGYHYFKTYPKVSAPDWQDGYKELTLAINNKQNHAKTIWIDSIDDRFYLWLLAYGPYSRADIQQIVGNSHVPKQINNIKLESLNWQQLGGLERPFIVVGKQDNIEEKINRASIKPSQTVVIKDYNGKDKFLMAEFGP